jgi:crotonobetaine/carnitine-CoA ligase
MVGEEAKTYAEIDKITRNIAAGLKRIGVSRGDAVVIMAGNSVETVCSWLALGLLGALEVCINTAYRGQTLEHALNTARARFLVISAEFVERIEESAAKLQFLKTIVVIGGSGPKPALAHFDQVPFAKVCAEAKADELELPDVQPSEIGSVIYTSGTTGPAKGVMMPHAQIYLLAQMTVEGLRIEQNDVFYCFHPMFHMAGKFMAVLGTMIAGGKIVLDRAFSPAQWLDRVREYRATVGLGHGPMLEMIYAEPPRPEDPDNPMRRILAAPFPKRIAQDFERRFGIRGIEVWGMTEVGVPCWHPYDEPLRLGSCGKNDQERFDVRIVDPVTDDDRAPGEIGEIVVRPKIPWILMQGYMGIPDQTVETWRNLWFHSGDSGYVDHEGYMYFVDRIKDRIRRRAENISSYDIESAAATHPAVLEVAAVGVPSDFENDDDIKLCVVSRRGNAVDPVDLLKHLALLLPHYMVPRYVEVLDALPRTPTNKVRKSELRARGVGDPVWDRKSHGISVRDLVAR